MARFPVIQRACPYKDSFAEMVDGDICRICSRQVHALDEMSEVQRHAFLNSCKEEICVSYSLPRSRKVAAVAISAAVMALPVAAEDSATESVAHPTHQAVPSPSKLPHQNLEAPEFITIVVGGIKDFSNLEYVDNAEDARTPELPVVYEDSAKED